MPSDNDNNGVSTHASGGNEKLRSFKAPVPPPAVPSQVPIW